MSCSNEPSRRNSAGKHAPRDKKLLQRQIDATDRKSDQLVYQLYGLTDKEIGIVEESTA